MSKILFSEWCPHYCEDSFHDLCSIVGEKIRLGALMYEKVIHENVHDARGCRFQCEHYSR